MPTFVASHGLSVWSFVLLPVLLVAPFALAAFAAWSLFRADETPLWSVGVAAVTTAGVAYLLLTAGAPARGFWAAWRGAAIASVVAVPLAVVREVAKRRC